MRDDTETSDEWIYDQVFSAVLEQRLIPGAKLKESDLCDIFGVSRTIIRRILLRLSLDKVVELRPNRGAVIATPAAEDVRQIFAARRLLEIGIIDDVCANCTAGDAKELRYIVTRENAAIMSGDRSGAIRLAGEFHLRLAKVAGNRPIHDLLRQLVAQSSLALALYEEPGHLLCIDNDHIDIVDAVAVGAIKKSRDLMSRHLENAEAEMKLDRPDDGNDLKAVFADIIETRASA
jgi:DNA-binding GntR family transcriptional regulator